MGAKVVALPGLSVPLFDGEPVPAVVSALERYLEKAKRGEIIAIGLAAVVPDGTRIHQLSTCFERIQGTAYSLESAINMLRRRFELHMDE